jgi:hypothetical protein
VRSTDILRPVNHSGPRLWAPVVAFHKLIGMILLAVMVLDTSPRESKIDQLERITALRKKGH